MHKIQTDPSGRLVYRTSHLFFTVIGGVKLDELEKLKVTLKIEMPGNTEPPIRHNLDLYNNDKLQKLAESVFINFDLEMTIVISNFSELIDQLELYRLDEIIQLNRGTQPKILTDDETAVALKSLKAENLIEKTLDDLQNAGYMGSIESGLLLYLAMTSRKCETPINVIFQTQIGIRSGFLVNKIANCIPEEDLLFISHRNEIGTKLDNGEELAGKVLWFTDENAEMPNWLSKPINSLKSVGRRFNNKEAKGLKLDKYNQITFLKSCIIRTIFEENECEDDTCIIIPLIGNNIKAHEAYIIEYQKKASAGLINETKEKGAQEKLQNMQRILHPVKVINPYATMINLPRELIKPCLTLKLLLSFIEAITFYHQYQRKKVTIPETSESYIETTPKDIELAFNLLKETLLRKSDELNAPLRYFLEQLNNLVKKEKLENFKAVDIRKHLKIPPRTMQYYLKELADYGYILNIGGKQRTGYIYEMCSIQSEKPLKNKIDEHVNTMIKKIQEAAKTRTINT